jgi:fumarylacetoacetate (FAA) hydrolase family protein
MPAVTELLTTDHILPEDHRPALLVGRIWTEGLGPTLVRVTASHLYDLSGVAATCSELLDMPDPAGEVAGVVVVVAAEVEVQFHHLAGASNQNEPSIQRARQLQHQLRVLCC